jgi:hypothetical protein
MDYASAQAVREYIVEHVALVLDSEDRWRNRLVNAATQAVADFAPGESNANQREFFTAALAGRGAFGYQRSDYANSAGQDVVDVLAEMIDDDDDAADGLCFRLLREVLDLGDSAQRDMFGDHYLPGSVDEVPWAEVDTDDDETDEDDMDDMDDMDESDESDAKYRDMNYLD